MGDVVDAEALRAARRRLQLSGWFDAVEVYTQRGSEPGLLVLRVDTVLDRGVRLETGFAHDPLRGWTLKVVGLRKNHLFGTANSGSIATKLDSGSFLASRLIGESFT